MELSQAERLRLRLLREGRVLRIKLNKDFGEPLGLVFDSSVFDGVRKCRNRCPFCFVDQLPPGLRPGLYVKDDDYRLSFLEGNFVSLTNLEHRDVRRIVESRLAPLYVSLHSAEPELRERIFGNRAAGASLGLLKTFLEEGLEVHLQVVVVPGLNDGEALRRTCELVAEKYPRAASLGLVPVGYTNMTPPELPRIGPEEATEVLDLADTHENVFASDEFYLKAGRPFPPDEAYRDYPQLHNGIGLARNFLTEAAQAGRARDTTNATVVTGLAAAPVLAEALGAADAILGVPNRLFGDEVSVAGLMAGQDILAAFQNTPGRAHRMLIPDCAVSQERLIDGMHIQALAGESGAAVEVIPANGHALIEALRGNT
jgi:putative radical SAM enzyme (TIGR03279 family)